MSATMTAKPTENTSRLKAQISRSALLKALAHVQSVVEKRATIPILAHVLLRAEGGVLSVSATDMEMHIAEVIEDAAVGSEGALTVPAATVFDIVKKLPDGAAITMEHDSTADTLALTAGRFKTKLTTLDARDFPSMTAGTYETNFVLPAETLRDAIDRVRFAISTEETRYYLNGIYMHIASSDSGEQELRMVATDGHRLSKLTLAAPDGADGMPGVIIPRKAVAELRKMADESDCDISMSVSETKMRASAGGITLTSKLIDGSFPEYERIIPRSNYRALLVSRKDFTDAIARVAAVSSDRTRPVKLTLNEGSLLISASGHDSGAASEEIEPAAFAHEETAFEIGFQARYLDDIASHLPEKMDFRFSDATAPAVVTDPSNPNALYIVMPMRV